MFFTETIIFELEAYKWVLEATGVGAFPAAGFGIVSSTHVVSAQFRVFIITVLSGFVAISPEKELAVWSCCSGRRRGKRRTRKGGRGRRRGRKRSSAVGD